MPVDDRLPEFVAKVVGAAENALEIVGNSSVEYGKLLIGKPVEHVGNKVVRSLPGEAPRRETGDLWANLQHTVDRPGPDAVELTVSSSRDERPQVPYELEFGSAKILPRPYMWGVGERPQSDTIGAFSVERAGSVLVTELKQVQ